MKESEKLAKRQIELIVTIEETSKLRKEREGRGENKIKRKEIKFKIFSVFRLIFVEKKFQNIS